MNLKISLIKRLFTLGILFFHVGLFAQVATPTIDPNDNNTANAASWYQQKVSVGLYGGSLSGSKKEKFSIQSKDSNTPANNLELEVPEKEDYQDNTTYNGASLRINEDILSLHIRYEQSNKTIEQNRFESFDSDTVVNKQSSETTTIVQQVGMGFQFSEFLSLGLSHTSNTMKSDDSTNDYHFEGERKDTLLSIGTTIQLFDSFYIGLVHNRFQEEEDNTELGISYNYNQLAIGTILKADDGDIFRGEVSYYRIGETKEEESEDATGDLKSENEVPNIQYVSLNIESLLSDFLVGLNFSQRTETNEESEDVTSSVKNSTEGKRTLQVAQLTLGYVPKDGFFATINLVYQHEQLKVTFSEETRSNGGLKTDSADFETNYTSTGAIASLGYRW